LLGDGRVLVVGGLVREPCDLPEQEPPCYSSTDSVELWDPRSAAFVAGPPLGITEGRAAHTATLLRDGRVMIGGGASNYIDELGDPVVHDLIWDSGSWRTLEDSAFRLYHSATLLDDGSVLFIGGQRDLCGCCAKADGAGTFASRIARYDPTTGRWTREGELLVPRERHGAALLSDGSVLVIGGVSQEWGHAGASFGSTERWTRTTPCGKAADPWP
jgi:hypothetical protein